MDSQTSDDHGTGDDALAREAAFGSRDAFEVIVRRHGPALYRFARRTLQDGDAEDVLQEALVAAWRNIDRFDGTSTLKTWLFAIVAHKVADSRRKKRAVPVDDDLIAARPSPVGDPVAHASRREFMAALEAALAELPYRQRACWILVEVDGMTQAEVSTILSITPDAVRGNLFRGRRNLSERMARWR